MAGDIGETWEKIISSVTFLFRRFRKSFQRDFKDLPITMSTFCQCDLQNKVKIRLKFCIEK